MNNTESKIKIAYNNHVKGKTLFFIHLYLSQIVLIIILLNNYNKYVNLLYHSFYIVVTQLVGCLLGFLYQLFILKFIKTGKFFKFISPSLVLVLFIITCGTLLIVYGMHMLPTIFLVSSFILGYLACTYDYKDKFVWKYMWVSFIPVLLSLIIVLYVLKEASINFIIINLILAYFYSFLLLSNNYRVHKDVYSSKSINIKNLRRMKLINYLMITAMFSVFILSLNIYKIAEILKEVFYNIKGRILVYIKEFLSLENPSTKLPGEEELIEKIVVQPSKILQLLTIIVLITLAVLLILFILFYMKKAIKLIFKRIMSKPKAIKKRKEKEYFSKEYIESSSIIKEKLDNKKPRNTDLYTFSHLLYMQSEKEQLRYLYGYIIEKMREDGCEILLSTTPTETYNLTKNMKSDNNFVKEVFFEVTEEYIKVRYGDKYPKVDFKNRKKLKKIRNELNKFLK